LKADKAWWRKIRLLGLVLLIVTLVPVGVLAGYAWESVNIPVEVKEPLEILDYPSGFSLYPGENVTFEITIQNQASVSYFVVLDFRLNDTDYQAKYVTFSSYNYSVSPGTQKLTAWLTVAPTAPPANFMLTISSMRDTEPDATSSASPEPSALSSTLPPSLELLSGGARWAAREGKTALYVNWKDNWDAHHLTDGVDWEWFPESALENWRSSITVALEQSGFEVTLAADIPDNFSEYDLVVLFAYYAVEPCHEPLISDYVFNGGNVVLLAGTQCYFTVYSKTLSTYSPSLDYFSGNDFTSIQEWFGCGNYVNTGGSASPAFDNPFGTSLSTNDILFTGVHGHAGVTSLNEDSQPIAFWDSGAVFAFTHEYGDGRVYYQAIVE
jgi:hypothetical protein